MRLDGPPWRDPARSGPLRADRRAALEPPSGAPETALDPPRLGVAQQLQHALVEDENRMLGPSPRCARPRTSGPTRRRALRTSLISRLTGRAAISRAPRRGGNAQLASARRAGRRRARRSRPSGTRQELVVGDNDAHRLACGAGHSRNVGALLDREVGGQRVSGRSPDDPMRAHRADGRSASPSPRPLDGALQPA